MPEVKKALVRMRIPEITRDEAEQLLRVRLFTNEQGAEPRIREYSGRGSLANWLRISAVRTAISLLRRESNALMQEDEDAIDLLARTDPELDLVKARCRPAFEEAFRAAVAKLTKVQRSLLRRHFVERQSFGAIAEDLAVSRWSVSRSIQIIYEIVRDETRRYFAEQLHLAPSEIESLIRVLQSQLNIDPFRRATWDIAKAQS